MDIGDVLADRYELLEVVGVGGMGRVLRARDRTLGRDVAVKLLAPHLLGDPDAVTALRDEARRAASVRHPNVVQVLDAVVHDTDQPAIIMQFVDGPSLADVVPAQGMPVDEALGVLSAIGAGLSAVHGAGLVHRDVCPGNVLLDDGVPRLTDFGIARSVTATATQTVRGSVGYLAPEQARGDRVGSAADVYALGCLATTLLTGRPPFTADTPIGVVHQHLHSEPPDLRERRPEVPATVAATVAQSLAKAPGERPATVADMLDHLGVDRVPPAVAVSGAPGPDDPTTVLPPTDGTRVLNADDTVGTDDEVPDDSPRRGWLALLLVGAAIAAAALVAGVLGGDDVPRIDASPAPVTGDTTSPAPSPSASPSPELSPREATEAGLRDLRELLVTLRSEEELTADAMGKLDERVAKALEKLGEDKPNDVAKELRELRKELGERVEDGEVSRAGEEAILTQVLQVEAALDEIPRGEGEGQDDDEDDD